MDKSTLLAAKMLREDEGVRKFVYQDHLGYWTIATGRCVDQRKGRGLSDDEIELMLKNDILENMQLAHKEIPTFYYLSDTRKAVLVCMYHQLGSLKGWPNFRKSIQDGDWNNAYNHMLASKWAKVDTPDRAKRMAYLFKKG